MAPRHTTDNTAEAHLETGTTMKRDLETTVAPTTAGNDWHRKRSKPTAWTSRAPSPATHARASPFRFGRGTDDGPTLPTGGQRPTSGKPLCVCLLTTAPGDGPRDGRAHQPHDHVDHDAVRAVSRAARRLVHDGANLGGRAGGRLLGGLVGGRQGGGCFYDPAGISTGQVLLTDIACAFILLSSPHEFHLEPSALDVFPRYLSFGVGLDPRQAQMYGPALGPILVGLCFGMVNFVTTETAPGYSGATMNPARCFGMAVASGDWSSELLLCL
ncbi:hypothetical protein PG984_006917 [Apiospora sp. TS-2023a]